MFTDALSISQPVAHRFTNSKCIRHVKLTKITISFRALILSQVSRVWRDTIWKCNTSAKVKYIELSVWLCIVLYKKICKNCRKRWSKPPITYISTLFSSRTASQGRLVSSVLIVSSALPSFLPIEFTFSRKYLWMSLDDYLVAHLNSTFFRRVSKRVCRRCRFLTHFSFLQLIYHPFVWLNRCRLEERKWEIYSSCFSLNSNYNKYSR